MAVTAPFQIEAVRAALAGGFLRIRRRAGPALALISLGLIAAFVIINEHWGHALGLLPYLILLACPALHLFSHGAHGRPHSRLVRPAGPRGQHLKHASGGAP